MKHMIIAHNGSVQNIPGIPNDVKAPVKPSTNDSASLAIKQEPVMLSLQFSLSPPPLHWWSRALRHFLWMRKSKRWQMQIRSLQLLCRDRRRGELEEAKLICSFIGQQGGVSDVLWLSDYRSRRFRRTVSSIGTLAQLSFPLTSLLAVYCMTNYCMTITTV